MAKKLLFGDDGSLPADSAWLWINSHSWPGWSIEVVRALPDRDATPPADRELLRPDVADALDLQTVHADPRWALHTQAAQCDLLVIGCRGHSLLKRMHLGSTAEWLMHGPPAPLVLVRGGHRVQRVLLAHDGSAHARAAEDALAKLPFIGSTQILVVTVGDAVSQPEQIVEDARQRLSGVCADVSTLIKGPDELQVFYRPRDVILSAAGEFGADLIAMGSRGLTVWESVNEVAFRRMGSNASAVAQYAQCSVLLTQAS